MVKLSENSFRDVNIAFANELSMLCDDMDIDVRELISLANRHPRVDVLNPGCGVGGHCISVDPWFIVDSANGKAKMIEQARRTNDYKADWVIEKIKKEVLIFEKDNGRKATIACMGLAFKPDIDDLRESPALYIAQELVKDIDIKDKYDFDTAITKKPLIIKKAQFHDSKAFFLAYNKKNKNKKRINGHICDICPTILDYFSIKHNLKGKNLNVFRERYKNKKEKFLDEMNF